MLVGIRVRVRVMVNYMDMCTSRLDPNSVDSVMLFVTHKYCCCQKWSGPALWLGLGLVWFGLGVTM